MEEAEDEMKNKQYGGEVYYFGLEIGESDGGSLYCWEGRSRAASLATVLAERLIAL